MADQNITRALAKRIGKKVYTKQRGNVSGLKGKTVRRVGTLLRVVEVNAKKGTITVNKVGEPANVVAKHNIKSFMSKKVEIVNPPGRPPKADKKPSKPIDDQNQPTTLDRAIDAVTTPPSKSEGNPATTTKDVATKNRRRRKKQRKRIRKLVNQVGPEILKGYL
jgi:hypothetical protein